MFKILNVLKRVDEAIDKGMHAYTTTCDKVERKVVNKISKQDIMIDDCLDKGCTAVYTLATETVVPFVKTTACTVKHAVCNKATVLKNKITATQEEGPSPFDWRAELACDAALAAALRYVYMNPMIQVHTTLVKPTLGTKPIILDGSAPVAKIITSNAASQAGMTTYMPCPVSTPVLYRMKRFVANVINHTPMCKCIAAN